MKRHFKTKKKVKVFRYLRYISFIFVLAVVLQISKSLFKNIKLFDSNEELIIGLLNDSNHHVIYEVKANNFLKGVGKALNDVDNPSSMLEQVFNYKLKEEDNIDMISNKVKAVSKEETVTNTENKTPLVYIYNSHQGETYKNPSYTVITGGKLLKEKLDNLGIPTIFEEADILEFMRTNNWNHAYSYKASKYYVEETLKNNPNLKLIIDFHRDSIDKSASTVEIDGKKYAKVLFVVGLEHDNYQVNLNLAIKLNDMIKNKYPTLTRGVMQKQGPGVNGIYNQNLNPNMILLEFGSEENTFEEITNTISVISNIIKEYVES